MQIEKHHGGVHEKRRRTEIIADQEAPEDSDD